MLQTLVDSTSIGLSMVASYPEKVFLDSTSIGVQTGNFTPEGIFLDSTSVGVTPESQMEDLKTNVVTII